MNLLDLDEPTVGQTPTVGRCVCGRKLWDPVSVQHKIGPKCREKLGIKTRQRVRLARVKPGGDCEGQIDLFEDNS